MDTFVKLENITKIYHMGEVEIRAVDGIDFSIQKGEFVVIVGYKWGRKDDGFEYTWRDGYCQWRSDHSGRSGYYKVQREAADGIPEGRYRVCVSVL